MRRREKIPETATKEYEPIAELLPDVQEDVDEGGFYEQLVTEYNQIPTSKFKI